LIQKKDFLGKWTIESIAELLGEVVKEGKLAAGDVFWPVRVALSNRAGSPSPQELAWILGKKETLARVKRAIKAM